jgi:AcrR family transcriptional regulator
MMQVRCRSQEILHYHYGMATGKPVTQRRSTTAGTPNETLAQLTRMEAVLRLLRGADVLDLADELGVPARQIEQWRDEFAVAGLTGFGIDRERVEPPAPAASREEPRKTAQRRARNAPRQDDTPPATPPGQEHNAGAGDVPEGSGWRSEAALRARGTSPAGADQPGGLWERKKARTRTIIRDHAMRLFREQGYAGTTVRQIAKAAEVSPSTFFRYFGSKEDVVFADGADVRLADVFHRQPPNLSPVQAVYKAMLEASAETAAPETVRDQVRLCLSEPELRATLFDNLTELTNEIATLTAQRVGRDTSEMAVRTLAAAVQGVWISVLFDWAENPSIDLTAAMEAAMKLLEDGLPL